MEQIETSYRHGYDLGMGVTIASGSPMALSVEGTVDAVALAPRGWSGFSLTEFRALAPSEAAPSAGPRRPNDVPFGLYQIAWVNLSLVRTRVYPLEAIL
jgi:hypothetical protein